jgi:hypothetical protein
MNTYSLKKYKRLMPDPIIGQVILDFFEETTHRPVFRLSSLSYIAPWFYQQRRGF